MKVVLHPQADAEFLLAQQRYTDASPPLGRRFYEEITGVFLRIIEHPLRYKQFDPPARRLFANGFPYAVIYVAKVWSERNAGTEVELCTSAAIAYAEPPRYTFSRIRRLFYSAGRTMFNLNHRRRIQR